MTGYAYVLRSNLTAITTPRDITERYCYDAVRNVLPVTTDGEGATWSYAYDLFYRLVCSTSSLEAEETYIYDKQQQHRLRGKWQKQ